MSHIVTVKTKVNDAAAVRAACQRLNMPPPEQGTAKLYGGEVTGMIVRLPGWAYPAVVNLSTGDVQYDIYGGAWGDQSHLDRFLQLYAVERAKLEARKKGFAVSEDILQDGSIRVQIREGD